MAVKADMGELFAFVAIAVVLGGVVVHYEARGDAGIVQPGNTNRGASIVYSGTTIPPGFEVDPNGGG